ncbi:MAG: ATPase [Kiritimatiellae bacterium]|nr:ATPase [Kiritimatiellia bacterium]
MAEDLQTLLEKIRRDGVEKADAEAAAVIAKAKDEAAAIVKAAKDEAAAALEKAKDEAAVYQERAKTTISQAARDVILEIEKAVSAKLEKLLAKDVDKALGEPSAAATFALAAVMAIGTGGDAEIAANSKIASALKAQLSAEAAKGVKIVTDETLESGFSVKLDGGRVEHDFTGAAVTAALAKRLRPDLAALVS